MKIEIFLIRIITCFALGMVIGFERQWRRKPIGLRTSTLVCLGSFLFVAMSCLVQDGDKTRVAAQVVSGIGFLGAGVILRDGMNVRGLNTAATLWCSAAIGTLTAFGLLIEALIGTIFILFSNIFLRYVSRKMIDFQKKGKKTLYSVEVGCIKEKEVSIKTVLMRKLDIYHMVLHDMNVKNQDGEIIITLTIESLIPSSKSVEKIVNSIGMEAGITSIRWQLEEHTLELDDDDNC